ncbi:hypothetical protein SteCoe_441 [Stentor coeruleus]|uniref:Uncharacterized protein n=1 Tax=Stentor coeruleus TaxID=5963 RepID=A0A1R2D471_9CILI|nr:hypothetical protein SteCoe_441 [Stentor coeruleus]
MEDNLRAIEHLKKSAKDFQDKGEIERAKDSYKKLLKVMEQVFPLYHYEFGEVYLNLSRCFQKSAEGVEALKYFLEYEKLFEGKNCGQKQLALVRFEIGLEYIKESIFEKALDYLQKSQKYIDTLSDIDESLSQTLYQKLAECYMQTNKHKEAIFYFEKYLSLINSNSQSQYNEEYSFYIDLSTCYISQGKYTYALTNLKKAKNIYKRNNTRNNEALSLIFELLGNTYSKLGNIDKSMKYIDKYQRIKGSLSINKNPDAWVLYMNIGNNLCKQGKYAEALMNYGKCLKFLEENPREDNLSIGELYMNLGILYKNIGKTNEAFGYLNKCKTIRERKEPDTVHLAEIYHQLGNYYIETYFYEQSIEYYEKYRNLIISHLPINDPKIAEATYLVVNSLMLIENYNEALSMLKTVDWEELCKENMHFLASVYNKFSTCLIVSNKIPRALQYCKKSKGIMDEAFIRGTVNYADCLYNFAWCYEISKDIRLSFKYYKECEKVLNKCYLAKDLRYAKLYMKLGVMNFYYENYNRSFKFLRMSLKLHLFLLKPNDKAFIPLFYHIGSVNFALENYNESIFYYRKCKDLQIMINYNDKLYYSKTLLCLGGAYLSFGLIKKAHYSFKESEETHETCEQKDFIELSNIINNKAICLAYNNDTVQALQLFNKSKSTALKHTSCANPILIRLYFNISLCYFRLRDIYETLEHLKIIKALIIKVKENKHPDLINLIQPSDSPVVSRRAKKRIEFYFRFIDDWIEIIEEVSNKTQVGNFHMKIVPLLIRKKNNIEKYIIDQVKFGTIRNLRFSRKWQKQTPKSSITNN